MLNCLDWDNKNDFNEGVTAFQIKVTSAGGADLPLLFFDAYGLNEAMAYLPGFTKDPDSVYVPSESTVKPSVLKSVMRTKRLVVKRLLYNVDTPPLGGTVQDQFDKTLNFIRTNIDGSIKRKGDIQPAFNRRNWMYQDDFLEIPGPFEVDGNTGMELVLGPYASVTMIWEIDSIV